MKNVKNPNFAGRDLNVGGTVYTGDAEGVMAMEDEHADKVLAMNGWSVSEGAPAEPESFDPVKALREEVSDDAPTPPAPGLAPAPTVQPPPPESVAELEARQEAQEPPPAEPEQPPAEPENGEQAAPSEDGEGDPEPASEDDDETGPDLEAITTKKGLFEVAKEYDVKLTAEQKKLDVDELRKVVDAAIYGDEEDTED